MWNSNSFNTKDILTSFDKETFYENIITKSYGVVYTPKDIVNFILSKILKRFLGNLLILSELTSEKLDFNDLNSVLKKDPKIKIQLNNIIKKVKILDPSCGSGRFLISAANYLLEIRKLLTPNLDEFILKKDIIENNIFGIDIDDISCFISKLRLIGWLFSNNGEFLERYHKSYPHINNEVLEKIFNDYGFKINIFNTDFLLNYNTKEKFDLIIGNPPYIENKKILDSELKKRLYSTFKSAFKLFDISILFLEKALNHLTQNSGNLSFILTNKFLAADYGLKIREILINNIKIEEIINISSIKAFNNISVYPIIFSLQNMIPDENHQFKIYNFQNYNDFLKNNNLKSHKLTQFSLKKLPAFVIPLVDDINIINYLYSNFNTLENEIKDLNIIYRPLGFLNYAKYYNNVSEKLTSKKDLILIGTGNLNKFQIKFNKRIKIAKNDIIVSYFKYNEKFNNIWSDFQSEKLIFREIAKDLTFVYDPGRFINITGLYFIRIPSFSTEKLFCLLLILNSNFINSIFKTLFSNLHMSAGYLRINASFVKRIPVPNIFPSSLSHLAKILQFLSQLVYELSIQPMPNEFHSLNSDIIQIYFEYMEKLGNSLVKLLYLRNYYADKHLNFSKLQKLLFSENLIPPFEFKYIKERLNLEPYKKEELNTILINIEIFYNKMKENHELNNEMELIKKKHT